MRTRFAVILLSLTWVGCEAFPCRNADTFQDQLRCGMSRSEVDTLALRYGADRLQSTTPNPSFGNYAIKEGRTTLSFWFENERLRAVQRSTATGLTGLKARPRTDLCTGKKVGSVELHIVAPANLAGAVLKVDGRTVAMIPSRPPHKVIIELPGGPHLVEATNARGERSTVNLVIGADASGKQELSLPAPAL